MHTPYICTYIYWPLSKIFSVVTSFGGSEWGERGRWGMFCDCCWAAASHIGSWLQMGVMFTMPYTHNHRGTSLPGRTTCCVPVLLAWQKFFDDVAEVVVDPLPLPYSPSLSTQANSNWSWWNFWVVLDVDISKFYWFNYLLSFVLRLISKLFFRALNAVTHKYSSI